MRVEDEDLAGGVTSRMRWYGWSPSLSEQSFSARFTATSFGSVGELPGKISRQEHPQNEHKAIDAQPKPATQTFTVAFRRMAA
jgi:hypothetical protein